MKEFRLLTGQNSKKIEVGNYSVFLKTYPNGNIFILVKFEYLDAYISEHMMVKMNKSFREYCNTSEAILNRGNRYITTPDKSIRSVLLDIRNLNLKSRV